MKNRTWIWLGLVPLAGAVAAQQAPPDAKPRRPEAAAAAASPAAAGPEAAIRERMAGYVKAFNGRNAAGLAGFFTEDAALVDEAGEATRGRDAILDSFATGFAEPTEHTLESTIESIRFVTPDVAQVEGTSKLSAENEASIVARFVALAAKKDGTWRIAEIRDLPAAPEDVPPSERLKEFEWMVGDWVDESPDATIHSTIRWGDNNAYLVRNSSVQVGDEKVSSSLMILGWDPQSGQFRSWLFDSEGGHGEATWTRASDTQWILRAEGVQNDGSTNSATQVVTIVNRDAVKTSSVDRIIGGEVAPDIDEVLMVRKPPAPAAARPRPRRRGADAPRPEPRRGPGTVPPPRRGAGGATPTTGIAPLIQGPPTMRPRSLFLSVWLALALLSLIVTMAHAQRGAGAAEAGAAEEAGAAGGPARDARPARRRRGPARDARPARRRHVSPDGWDVPARDAKPAAARRHDPARPGRPASAGDAQPTRGHEPAGWQPARPTRRRHDPAGDAQPTQYRESTKPGQSAGGTRRRQPARDPARRPQSPRPGDTAVHATGHRQPARPPRRCGPGGNSADPAPQQHRR